MIHREVGNPSYDTMNPAAGVSIFLNVISAATLRV